MKKVQYLFVAAALLFCGAVRAQQDFSGPQYAKWGDTVEERQKNILSSNFLKEACDNKDYNAAAQHFMELVQNAPSASENTYVRGALLYKNKINRAKSLAEKEALVDSLLWTYDLRVQYFGGHPTRGRAYILDRKAREYLTYRPNDRAGIRRAFRDAIEAGVPPPILLRWSLTSATFAPITRIPTRSCPTRSSPSTSVSLLSSAPMPPSSGRSSTWRSV